MSLKKVTPCDERDPMTGQFYCPYIWTWTDMWIAITGAAEEPVDYPELDAAELEEFQSFKEV